MTTEEKRPVDLDTLPDMHEGMTFHDVKYMTSRMDGQDAIVFTDIPGISRFNNWAILWSAGEGKEDTLVDISYEVLIPKTEPSPDIPEEFKAFIDWFMTSLVNIAMKAAVAEARGEAE